MSLAAALRSRDLDQLPSRRDEAWRWTGLRELIRALPPPSPEAEVAPGGPWAEVACDEHRVVNGRCEPFGGLVRLGPGEASTRRLRFVASPEAGAHAARVQVRVEARADLVLLESYEGLGAGYVAAAELDIEVAEGARLTRLVLAEDAEDAVSASQADVRLAPGARLHQSVIATGARRQRIETRVLHPGQGAEARLDGLYVLGEQRHSDHTTSVEHQGPGGLTRQLIKGVAAGQARGVFQGRIAVAKGADGTDARMGHHALILSEQAEIDAKPELEIFADDVACAHGATVGALDPDQLFYARARGLPETEAKALLTAAFLGEVVERIEPEAAREVARAFVEARLRGLA